MALGSTTCLAVARLDELTPARSHRYREGQPMHGFCLINGDRGHYRVTLYIENGRTLGDRSGQAGFYYEGWLLGPEGPVSLGAFNLGPEGQGSATRVVAGSMIRAARSELVRVTAEPFGGSEAGSIAVLEGRLIWLETGEAGQAEIPAADPGLVELEVAPVPEPVLQRVAGGGIGGWESLVEEQAEEADEAGQPTSGSDESGDAGDEEPTESDLPGDESDDEVTEITPPEEREDGEAAETAAPAEEEHEATADPGEEEQETAADPGEEPPAPPAASLAELVQAAADRAPRHVNPLSMQVQLVQRHPMAPRAAGAATMNLRQGGLTLTLRGLPSPTALGRDRATNRPFNTYRVWLVNQQSGSRTPVGYCERAWGENFRFQAEGLPLSRHDTILVTAEDRTASHTAHAAPQVLMGSYVP